MMVDGAINHLVVSLDKIVTPENDDSRAALISRENKDIRNGA